MSRRTELVIGAVTVGGAVLFAAFVLVWRVAYDDAWWSLPSFPRMTRWEAFDIYLWLKPFACVAAMAILVVARVRRDARLVAPSLAVTVSFATGVIYLPLWFLRTERTDRLLGVVEEAGEIQVLVVMAMLVLLLSIAFIAVTRARRTPQVTRQASLVVAMAVNAGLLLLFWVPMIMPFDWSPMDRRGPGLFTPVRVCRGATVWMPGPYDFTPIGTIDDIWLQFADPRKGNAPTYAVSVSGSWRKRAYYWLNSSDLQPLRVHSSDPALVDCDTTPRSVRVAPAKWHELGVVW
jgi:hypothetical protein